MTASSPSAGFSSVADFDPLDPGTLQCPYPWHRALRAEAPVHYVASRGMWFVTSRELVTEALGNPGVYSSAFGSPQLPAPESIAAEVAAIAAQGWPVVSTLLTADPPRHHYYRRMVARAFTTRLVARLEPEIREIARDVTDGLNAGAPVEFVREFANPLPLRVIAHVLNVPAERIDDFKRWSDQFTASVGAELDDAGRLEQARALLEFQRYFAGELDARRAKARDDLLSGLVAAPSAESEDEPLSTAACLGIIHQLLVAGNETTTTLLSGVLHQLALAPHWWEWLREDPEGRAGAVVEEGLRFVTPVQSMFRITRAETELGGQTIPAGARVVLVFGSANRDEQLFGAPDAFDPTRPNAKLHLAFGYGIHVCLGAPLGRLEARIALAELARRFTTVTCAPGFEVEFEPSFILRGMKELSLILGQ
ncbi:cytochrome P450 [Nocardia huaxiensis]|uniref:Cytochrome P450 n=1 Tax=Nocardia huaxiensis TaxID=2755382 RepID=A0A7D6ZDX3_9NOCA|nr:cytochrome P450 [Nocardia huaxiensis]QLY33228.1 cytochrome P450 [Nocardia huaxiensis]UFS99839.1 cytochrome P450 [Nocardia huaxiensis]